RRRIPPGRHRGAGAGGVRPDGALRLRFRVALHHDGPGGRFAAGGAGAIVSRLPAVVRVLGLRAGLDDAGLDAGIRQSPADDLHGRHGALAHRWAGGACAARALAVVLSGAGVAVVAGARRGVRAACGVEVEEVITAPVLLLESYAGWVYAANHSLHRPRPYTAPRTERGPDSGIGNGCR